MPGVRVKVGDSVDQAWRFFKKQVEIAGVMTEIKKRQSYDKPSVKLKKKRVASQKRNARVVRGFK